MTTMNSTSPKEKAKELVLNCFNAMFDWHTDWMHLPKKRISFRQSKKASLVMVYEILEVVVSAYHKLGCGEIGDLKDYIPYIFWNKVKEEIAKL